MINAITRRIPTPVAVRLIVMTLAMTIVDVILFAVASMFIATARRSSDRSTVTG